jgi:cellulose synthase/poly-beta-1,6-N-acetylglucosamine synthase-like glycosyltransferase
MHNKYAILDNKTIITGSYNFTFGAEFLNYENLIVINDNSQLVSSYNENFNFLVNSAKNVTNFDYDINKVEDISISILQNEIATSESIFDSTRKEDYDYETNSLVELYNLGRIETTARSILTLIEDKLPHVTNQRLLKISYLILRETGDDALAQICLDRIDNSSKIEEAAPLLIKYKLKILL